MGIKKIVISQYQDIVNLAAETTRELPLPPEGWIRTVRKALNMSGAQLARRLGVSRALVSNSEKAELSGSVTLKHLRQMAEAMECRLVYAIVPEQTVKEILTQRATTKASRRVGETSKEMALEAQALSEEQILFEVERLRAEILNNLPRDLWDDD